ncbi:MAG: GNAT family N-acetyltransferase, partial [Nocardioidaceae bacterium]
MPLTLRPAEPGERDAVVALTRACLAPEDRGDAGDLERLLWGDPRGRGLVVVAERDGRLVGNAFGSLGAPADTGDLGAYVTMLTVAGTERRAGIGGKLLRTLETKCRTRGATSIQAGGSAPVYWWPGVDTRCSGEIAFFRAMGYDVHREAMNLSVDLVRNRALVTEPAPEGLPVRRLGGEEWPEFGAWMERTWGATWAEE